MSSSAAPQPSDCFRTMEDVSGRDLAVLARILLHDFGSAVTPVDLELTYSDGTTDTFPYPVEIWYDRDRYVAQVPATKQITRARVNPDGFPPDIISGDDSWTANP